jgi:hypothetical protein
MTLEELVSYQDETWGIRAHPALEYPLETVYRYLRKVLQAKGVEYIVAPYSATAEVRTPQLSAG